MKEVAIDVSFALDKIEGEAEREQAAEGIVFIDSETLRLVEFNDAACHGLGYSREEFA